MSAAANAQFGDKNALRNKPPGTAADHSDTVWRKGKASFNTSTRLPRGAQIVITVERLGWEGPLGVWEVGSTGYSKKWAMREVTEGAVLTFACRKSAKYGVASQLNGFNFADLKSAVAQRKDSGYQLTFSRDGDQSERVIHVRVQRGPGTPIVGALPIRWGKGRASFNTSGGVPAGSELRIQIVSEGWKGRLGVWRVGASDYLRTWSAEEVTSGQRLTFGLDRTTHVGISSQLDGRNKFATLKKVAASGSGYRLEFARDDGEAVRVVHVTVVRASAIRPNPVIPPRVSANPPTTLGVFGSPAAGRGVLVNDVVLNSLAHKMGVRRGDRLLSINGVPVRSTTGFKSALARTTDSVRVVAARSGKTVNLKLDWRR
jgi:hypothetical protein